MLLYIYNSHCSHFRVIIATLFMTFTKHVLLTYQIKIKFPKENLLISNFFFNCKKVTFFHPLFPNIFAAMRAKTAKMRPNNSNTEEISGRVRRIFRKALRTWRPRINTIYVYINIIINNINTLYNHIYELCRHTTNVIYIYKFIMCCFLVEKSTCIAKL